MTAQATPINVTATGVVSALPATFRGCSLGSVAGSTVTLYDNASAASGTVLASFTIAANGFQTFDIADGVRCANGIYMSAGGTVAGHVRIG